ncbi:MAG: hypothetical protein HY062_17115 [Bacteroidetes bacterium]|nr:hypothetical protein [Bacteroidota bacterium]
MNYGMEIELLELLILQLFAFVLFGRFEVETSAARRIIKWLVIYAITIGLYCWTGHWAALVPVLVTIPGTIYHIMWCKKNGIHPFKATPRKKYYQLRGWKWKE